MGRRIFVNLPVKDLSCTVAFFTALGFTFDPKFSNPVAACLVVSADSFVMLLSEPFFQSFSGRPVCDAAQATEVITCLSCDSREEVDDLVARAVAAGGCAPRPAQDHGFMYGHGFEDPDGHIWELCYMVPGAEIEHISG